MAQLHESEEGLRRRRGGAAAEGATAEPGIANRGPAAGLGSSAEGQSGSQGDASDAGSEADIGSEAEEGGAVPGTEAGRESRAATAAATAGRAPEAGTVPPGGGPAADGHPASNGSPAADGGPGPGPGAPPGQPHGTISTGLTPELAARIAADFPSCCSGHFMAASSSQRRFLTCFGVHRCMALFAWTPGKDARGFAANLTSGAVRFSLEQRAEFLPEVVAAMCRAFDGVPKSKVVVQLVGDLVGEPLQRYFSEMPPFSHACSLHLEAALRKAGFRHVDKDLCAAFVEEEEEQEPEGLSAEPAEAQEPAPRPTASARGAPRFSLAALDLRNGQIIVLNSGSTADVKDAVKEHWPRLEEEFERDRRAARDRSGFAPMTHPNGRSADLRTAYHEMVANPLPYILIGICLIALLFMVAPTFFPEDPMAGSTRSRAQKQRKSPGRRSR